MKASYEYDAIGWRVNKRVYLSGEHDTVTNGDYFYYDGHRVIEHYKTQEEDTGGGGDPPVGPVDPPIILGKRADSGSVNTTTDGSGDVRLASSDARSADTTIGKQAARPPTAERSSRTGGAFRTEKSAIGSSAPVKRATKGPTEVVLHKEFVYGLGPLLEGRSARVGPRRRNISDAGATGSRALAVNSRRAASMPMGL